MEATTAMTNDEIHNFSEFADAKPPAARQLTPPRRRPTVFLNDIRVRAFQKWMAAGEPAGDCLRFWDEAERELLQESA
jgi:hypothetical protein